MSALVRCLECGAMFGGLNPEHVAHQFRVHDCAPRNAQALHPSNTQPTPGGAA